MMGIIRVVVIRSNENIAKDSSQLLAMPTEQTTDTAALKLCQAVSLRILKV